jgi:putative tricarboxylic transport membrane protein
MSRACPVINFAGRKIAVDISHLTFATGLAAWITWFCWDAWHASPAVENLILIMPVSAVAVVLYLFVVVDCFKYVAEADELHASRREPLASGVAAKVAGSMALLGAYVVAGPLIGFDVASFAYMLAMMCFLGERRILVLLLVPLLFCVAVIYCFNTLLSTPLPLFFGERA